MKFGIHFTSCSKLLSLQRVEFIPKFHFCSFVQVKMVSDFQTRFMMSSGFFALLTPARHAVKVENRSRLTFFVHRAEVDTLSS